MDENIFKIKDVEFTYVNGMLHSTSRPAIKYDDGREEWWKDGVRHRDGDLPAVILFNLKEWWKDGERHRDGNQPAVLSWRQRGYYFQSEKNLTVKEWWVHNQLVKKEDVYHKTTEYFKNNKLHRDDGPAVESGNSCSWWKDGKKHRDGDLPAVICADGSEEWWKDGVCHRDGDLPAVIGVTGRKQWWKNGVCHRDGNLPAAINPEGYLCLEFYVVNGKFHRPRELGPAIISNEGVNEYWENGKYLFNSTIFDKLKHVFSIRRYYKEQRELKKLSHDEEFTPVLRESIAEAKGDLFYLRKNDTEVWCITRNEAKAWIEFAVTHNRPIQNHYTTLPLTQWEQTCGRYYLGMFDTQRSDEKLYCPVSSVSCINAYATPMQNWRMGML